MTKKRTVKRTTTRNATKRFYVVMNCIISSNRRHLGLLERLVETQAGLCQERVSSALLQRPALTEPLRALAQQRNQFDAPGLAANHAATHATARKTSNAEVLVAF